ncbi:MAG: cupin domain-containing protein [Gemmatimonadota bacterium]|nr:cupin domain-containing protein [Gemmatimonadota bacterium]|tara:strand:+ start:25940 stop:26305 length:366 start_codon:yes stop_codon:yes gene_type:complete
MTIRPRRVEKPWGYELIWAETELYVAKILHVNAGEALSVQMHEQKDETLHLLSGQLILQVGLSPDDLEPVPFEEGDSYRIRPKTVHFMQAVTDVDVLEASTSHLDDVVRFRDRYGRVPSLD